MPRLRTIKKAIKIIKNDDPDTAITEYLLRQLVIQGYIPSIKSGVKYLIDVDVALDYLYNQSRNIEK